MSWDVVLFNSKEEIHSIEDLDESQLQPIDFCSTLKDNFKNVTSNGDHREIKGPDYSIEYYLDEEKVSNKIINLYGENALYALIPICKKYKWQIFDTSSGQMIDLNNPSKNGYDNFQKYLQEILNK